MQNAPRSPLFLVLAALLGALFPPVAHAAQSRHEEFKTKFRQAMSINSRDEMAKLVREYQDEAVWLIVGTCEAIAERPSDELETLIDGLRKAWQQAVNTSFVDNVYEYYSLLDPVLKREQQELSQKFKRAQTKMFELIEKKDGPGFEILGNELNGMAEQFELVGDRYYASQTWMMYGNCFDEGYRGVDGADLKKATKGFGKALELRKAIGLEDQNYRLTKVRYDQLVAQGYAEADRPEEGPGDGDAGGPPPPGAVEPTGGAAAPPVPTAPVTASLEFDLLETLDEVERPNYAADDFYQMWVGLGFGAKDSVARFQSITDGPSFVRAGASDVRWDADGNGAAGDEDPKVPLTGNLTPVVVEIGKGDEARSWAVLTITGLEKDQYQYVGEINLGPSDAQMTIYAINAGSMVGDIAGTPVRIIDDNMDGIYGSPPKKWAYAGLSRDVHQPDMDSIVIGAGKRAVPWSEYQQIGAAWYKLEVEAGGKRVKATPVELKTGRLQLDFKGAKPSWLILKGDGKYENCYFDLTAGPKGVEVPVGRYTLFCGELRKGKKRQATKSLILPGKKTPSYSVAAGETTEVELGAPFGFDFRFTRGADKVTLEGASVVVTGKAEERYERVWGAVPRPEVSWRKEGAKRGTKGEEMDVVMDLDGIAAHGFAGAWAPLDMTFEIKGVEEGEKIELQLVEKKNDLFGSIESSWK